MAGFADFLDERRVSILERFMHRLPGASRDGLTRSELVDHLPQLLTDVAQAIRDGSWPAERIVERSEAGATHGRQRLRIGFSLDAVVREYGLLHDCIHEALEPAEAPASVRELRSLAAALAGALAESVAEHTAASLGEAQRQQAQRELAEERYRTLFETIEDGYCLMQMMVDANGKTVDYRFLEANAAFEGQTGLVGALGKTARELVPDLDESWFERYGRVAATGEAESFESHAPAMGRWFEVFATRVGRPELRQVALVFKDVTQRKAADEEQTRLHALERAARSEAENASRLKDEFLAAVSHELRTPLNAMLGWVQMLRSGTVAPEKYERALETIERNARAQAQLIEDLLDVSSVLAGKLRLEIHALDLAAIIEGVVETVRPTAEAKSIRVQLALASGGSVMGDSARLQQIAWNLLSNAVKFTPLGGRVQVTLEQLDSAMELVVADTGIGIAEEFQPHVFERFRQAEGGTTRSQGGLGLGLSIVHQLVEMHGGRVNVESEGVGRGSTFRVRIPLAGVRPKDAPLHERMGLRGFTCPPELASLRVLLVDDEVDARELLRALLESCGASVRVAASAAEAFALFEQEPPDVLLSDIGMPDEDGYTLVGRVRKLASGAGKDVPAVALTAYARPEDCTRALLSGFSSHVSKPVEPRKLLAVIAALANRTGRPRVP